MTNYARLYRLGVTPWERYGEAAATSIATLLDREEADRTRPLGRALDLGCGRGLYTRELARRGWETVGVDYVPAAIAAAERRREPRTSFAVADVTALSSAELGTFDFFLDIGCLQGLDTEQRKAEGEGVTALANPGATLLVMAFGATRLRSFIGGVTEQDVASAFPAWEMLSVVPATTEGLGWPMNRTSPHWYRLRRRT